MTLVPLDPIPQRNTQGTKITSLQHDEIHEDLRAAINALIAEVNTLSGGSGSSAPTGSVFAYAGTTEPTGYFFVNGAAKSRTLYASLFAVCGTTYGAGDGVTTFNLPNVIGRVISGTNPMGGVTEGGLTLRALGATFGAETVSYTPAGSVSQASIGSLTATSSAINTSALVVPSAGLQSLIDGITASSTHSLIVPAADLQSLINGITATSSAVDASGITVSVTLSNGAVTGVGTASVTNNTACLNVMPNPETGTEAIECGSNLTVDISDIAAGLTTAVTVSSATLGSTTLPSPTITVAKPTATNITVTGTITTTLTTPTASNISIGGPIPTPTITLGGFIPVQTFTGTPANVSTLQPSIAMNYIIKY